jgi:hypothetical protein
MKFRRVGVEVIRAFRQDANVSNTSRLLLCRESIAVVSQNHVRVEHIKTLRWVEG